CPDEKNDSMSYKKTRVAEPTFKFEVRVIFDNVPFKREFLWPLPKNHQCRLLVNLYDWACNEYLLAGNALPVFSMPYMAEIFMAQDEEEVNRLIGTALESADCSMIDLLFAVSQGEKEEVVDLLINDLSLEYQKFLWKFQEVGFFAVMDGYYDDLRKAYSATFEKYLKVSADSTLGPLLQKVFMVVSLKNKQDLCSWVWQEYLDAAIVTPLHPAVLDMIRHQHIYLCESFCYHAVRALEEPGVSAFSLKHWNRVVDHAKIQWPIFGILTDANKVLDTNMRSFNYFHLAGKSREEASFVTSRLLLQYEDLEDEEITDAELFRETQSSELIKQVLINFRRLYPFADDGINIGAYCGKEIQPIIAGIDSYLSKVLIDPERGKREYSLKLTIFSDSRDDSSVARWVNAWKDRWQAAEHSSGKRHYKNCQISIFYRVVSMVDNARQFKNLLQHTSLDLMIFSGFIKAGASDFKIIENIVGAIDDYRKFPVLEKACCREIGGGRERIRERVLSNPRFQLGALHSEVMAHMKKGPRKSSNRHAVVSQSNYRPWSELVDIAHDSSTWV
ncbi:MAG: ATP-binding protein, partial [Firmicutes bacterium]|nr:ATP-binding protein [Bacillota bacterium]